MDPYEPDWKDHLAVAGILCAAVAVCTYTVVRRRVTRAVRVLSLWFF